MKDLTDCRISKVGKSNVLSFRNDSPLSLAFLNFDELDDPDASFMRSLNPEDVSGAVLQGSAKDRQTTRNLIRMRICSVCHNCEIPKEHYLFRQKYNYVCPHCQEYQKNANFSRFSESSEDDRTQIILTRLRSYT